jgi:hypothetical protein
MAFLIIKIRQLQPNNNKQSFKLHSIHLMNKFNKQPSEALLATSETVHDYFAKTTVGVSVEQDEHLQ